MKHIEDEVEKRFNLFKNFEVLRDPPPDHHYINYKQKVPMQLVDAGSTLAKRVLQEWKILETCLPDSIFVRAYETRIDLMRAAIVGAEGTPYRNGLFFFDICFSRKYPIKPPKVFYHSHGLHDVNPNLHEGGQICLSLLNTWIGRKEERWNAKQSTLLQVLVSIQGLVLNAKPYFNEALHQLYIFSEVKSLKYNNDAFMQTRMAMIYTLRKPPKQFEDFVAGHFRRRAHSILMDCKANMDISKSMNLLFVKVVKAFEANGTSCRHLVDDQVIEEAETDPYEKSENNGFIIIRVLMGFVICLTLLSFIFLYFN